MKKQISVTTFYRLSIWMPIAVPAVVISLMAIGRGGDAGALAEVVAYSLLWGGIPYTALAIWATWWVGGRPEAEIRHLMFRAPLLMAAIFVPLALVLGLIVGAPGPFFGVAVLGALSILALGYGYVGLTALLRSDFEERIY